MYVYVYKLNRISLVLVIIMILINLYGCTNDQAQQEGEVMSTDNVDNDREKNVHNHTAQRVNPELVGENILLSIIIVPAFYEGIYTLRLSSDGVLTTSVGERSWVPHFEGYDYMEYHDYIRKVGVDFILAYVERTKHIELMREQLEELLYLMSHISDDHLEQRGDAMGFGVWYLDIIYNDNLYSYFFDDVYEDTSGSYVARLVRTLLEHSLIPIDTTPW